MSTWSPKQPASTEYFPVDLVRQLAPGDTITSCSCSIALLAGTDPGLGAMLVGPVIINGTTVAQKVGGGVSGCRYQLSFAAVTLLGETLPLNGDFTIGTVADPRDLTTVDTVKGWLNLKATDDDPLLQRLITAQSRLLEAWLSRPIVLQPFISTYDGPGGSNLCLKNYPIQAVSNVLVDAEDVTAKVDHDDISIWRTDNMNFPMGTVVTVAYTAGFPTVPFDIEQACIELVSLRYRERDRIGHQSKSLGGETVSFYIKAMPDSVLQLLSQYRRVVPC